MKGEVLMTIVDSGPASVQLKSRAVRGLAVTAPRRMPAFPEIPTMAEAGVADMVAVSWTGFLAPAGAPPAIVKKLGSEGIRLVKPPEVPGRAQAPEPHPGGSTSAEFARVIAADLSRWSAVAKAANIKMEP